MKQMDLLNKIYDGSRYLELFDLMGSMIKFVIGLNIWSEKSGITDSIYHDLASMRIDSYNSS